MFVAVTFFPSDRVWKYICYEDGVPKITSYLKNADFFHSRGETIDFVDKVAPELRSALGCRQFGYLEIQSDFDKIGKIDPII